MFKLYENIKTSRIIVTFIWLIEKQEDNLLPANHRRLIKQLYFILDHSPC